MASRDLKDNRRGSVGGPQCQFPRVGGFAFPPDEWPDCDTAVFCIATSWPSGLTPRFGAERHQFNPVAAYPSEAILESSGAQLGSATMRYRRPISEGDRKIAQPADFQTPDE